MRFFDIYIKLSSETFLTLRRIFRNIIINLHRSLRNVPVIFVGTAVAQWLRCCATNRKVAGSIPDGVIGIFH